MSVKNKIESFYLKYIKKNMGLPSRNDLIAFSKEFITRDKIRHYYQNYTSFEELMQKKYPEAFENLINKDLFNDENARKLEESIKNYDYFVITTAVTGKLVHEKAFKSLQNYCKANNAKLLILPCSDPASNSGDNWELDPALGKDNIVFKDLKLNNNFFISNIKLSAKHINPLTGLSRIGQRQGSFVYASPKQSLEYVATSLSKKIPRALMTTGAVTVSDYKTSKYMSERTSYLANADHVLGAIIVEIENSDIFHFRQIQIEPKTGDFYDLDKKYTSDGKIIKSRAALVQLGDYHVGETDTLAKQVAKDICALVQPKYLTLEDFFNGHSVSHHDEGKCLTEASKVLTGKNYLSKELEECQKELNDILTWKIDHIVVKYGNHEDFLYRWLNRGGYLKQPQNHAIGVKIANALLNEGFSNPIEYALTELYPLKKDKKKVTFLGINDSFKVGGVENGAHGHLGPNGSMNPGLMGLEKAYGAVNAGHTHTAGILRSVFRVGTTSFLKVSYNNGPSSWTQTHLIQHTNGSRQLINCIEGKFRKQRRK
ncbi:MAG: hypothetical protein MOGMAGMI_00370 [Candidatus Omnitrophica bacterium]|nr:hypothetical protein [Candidatus Omnitrophota bacterium]